MTDRLLIALCLAALAVGCTHSTDEKDHPAQSTIFRPAKKLAEWDPSIIEGGYMFKTGEDFRSYVRSSEIVGLGTLTEWDGSRGTVKPTRSLKGRIADRQFPILSSGGVARVKAGDEVLFLLQSTTERQQLHSHCGASGLYAASEKLNSLVKSALAPSDGNSD